MHLINAANIRDALPKAVKYVMVWGKKEPTRIGDALVAQNPVTIKYFKPKEHVLTSSVRDANPFFHLMEAMWMLAGRDDGKFLDYYVKDFSKMYGHNGRIMDAYGYRWRHGLEYNQLGEIVRQLKETPTTRQAVLQMWGAGSEDLISHNAKPCNLVATFRMRGRLLDMTVFNRSNDLIFGCCGANAVHFPILQEYIAGRLGVQMGMYWQISTNLHLYVEHIDMLSKRAASDHRALFSVLREGHGYEGTQPLVDHPDQFDEDLAEVIHYIDLMHKGDDEFYDGNIANSFLRQTVLPMALAHSLYKEKNYESAKEVITTVKADDWRLAGTEWIERHSR